MIPGNSSVSWFGSVRGQLYSALVGMVLAITLLAGLAIVELVLQQPTLIRSSELSSRVAEKEIPLIKLIGAIQLDVVQVQQWLTDISATRAQDGLNDGFDEAEKMAQQFRRDVAEALELSAALGFGDVSEALMTVQKDFPPYYDVGKTMAQAYIDGGPESGNRMMAGFDAKAEALGESIEKLTDITEKHGAVDLIVMRDQSHEILESNKQMIVVAAVPAVIALLIAMVGIVVVRRTIQRLDSVTGAVAGIAGGDLSTSVPMTNLENEIGQISSAVDSFRLRLAEGKELEAQQKEADQKRIERASKRESLTAAFGEDVTAIAQNVSSSAGSLQSVAQAMSETSGNTSDKADEVARAADSASANVQTVATAAEELSASIAEISRQVNQSAGIASSASEQADNTTQQIQGLVQSAGKISEVVGLISDIAEQTNLLALNATIEAARAGEAGKGFAVVASEVKNLANQTARATEEISEQVSGIQSETQNAVDAINSITGTISEINEISSAIASAVEEQGSATQEIARNVQEAASGTQNVTATIGSVRSGAEETRNSASTVLEAANTQAGEAATLEKSVRKFLSDLEGV